MAAALWSKPTAANANLAGTDTGELRQPLWEANEATQQAIESGARPVVGVNIHGGEEAPGVTRALAVDSQLEAEQLESLRRTRASRVFCRRCAVKAMC